MPQGEIKAIVANITRSGKKLENLPGKSQKSKASKQNSYYVYHIQGYQNCYNHQKMSFGRWCNGLSYWACMPNKNVKNNFFALPFNFNCAFSPRIQLDSEKSWKLYHIMVGIKYGIRILRSKIVTVLGIKYDRSQNLRESE